MHHKHGGFATLAVTVLVLLLVAALNVGFLAFIIWLAVSIAKAVWQ